MPESQQRRIDCKSRKYLFFLVKTKNFFLKDCLYILLTVKNPAIAPGTPDRKYVRVGDDGLSAEFESQVGSRLLNEDNGRDEVYAQVWLADRLNHQTVYFRSGVITAEFAIRP